MLVDKNAEYIKDTILSIVKEHWKLLIYSDTDIMIRKEDHYSEITECINHMRVTCSQIVDDLNTYYNSLTVFNISMHIISWKSSPDITPCLEKDIVKESLLKSITRLVEIEKQVPSYTRKESKCTNNSAIISTSLLDRMIVQPYHTVKNDMVFREFTQNTKKNDISFKECTQIISNILKRELDIEVGVNDWKKCNKHLVGFFCFTNPILNMGSKIKFPHFVIDMLTDQFYFELTGTPLRIYDHLQQKRSPKVTRGSGVRELPPKQPSEWV
jgi:hypothetical protein